MGKVNNEFINYTDSGFIGNHNYELVDCDDGKTVVLKAKIDENSLNPYGVAHGGFVFGLGYTAMGLVARSTGRKAVTLSANITYLKPSTGEYLIANGEMIKNGKTTCFLRCNIYNDKDVLVATMDCNYYYID